MSRASPTLGTVAAVAVWMAACGGGGSDADTDGGQSNFQDSSSGTSGGTNAGTRSKHGHVTVDGTVFGFSVDPPGRVGSLPLTAASLPRAS